jgi:hypothetical protein
VTTCNRQEEQKKGAEHELGELFTEQDRLTKETQQAMASAKEPQKNMKQVSEHAHLTPCTSGRSARTTSSSSPSRLSPPCAQAARNAETASTERADAERALEVAKDTLSHLENTLQERQQVGPHALVLCARAPVHLYTSSLLRLCTAVRACRAWAHMPSALRAGTPSV